MDIMTPDRRSQLMGRIRGKDTRPELTVRRILHAAGYRYRLHVKRLPGSPDIVFPSRRKVVFVHGCFWHQHPGCRDAAVPKSRVEFWQKKLQSNRDRDRRTTARLESDGWQVVTVWECEAAEPECLSERLADELGPPGAAR